MSRSGADNERWVRPSGSTRQDGWDVAIDDDIEGWQHTSLYAARLAEGESREVPAGEWEHVVVPLSGSVTVECVHGKAVLVGRPSVFAGPTDIAYVARDTALTVTATGGPARVAVCGAQAAAPHTPSFRHVEAAEVPVELRGAGTASREVRNFGIPGVLDADSLIACEVVTPAGNWSSYPPHKHDEEREGVETELEEIYYFETQVEVGAPAPAARIPLATNGSTAPTTGRSTSWPRCAPATSCWCRTAGTDPRWPRRATTCTTSTSWRAPATNGPGSSVTTPPTAGCARPGRRRTSTPDSHWEDSDD